MLDGVPSWSYQYGGFDPGDWRAWLYWNELLTNHGADGWPEVNSLSGARAFESPFSDEDTAPEVLYSLLNGAAPLEIACTPWGPFALPHGHDGNDHIFLSGGLDESSNEWLMRTIAHEVLHGKGHFPHTCGRPSIEMRDWNNKVMRSDKDAYASPNPPVAVSSNVLGNVRELRLLAEGSVRMRGGSGSVWDPAEYPNNYANDALIFLPGHDRVRLYFDHISTEECCDFISLFDNSNKLVARYSGEHYGVWTDWMKGPKLRVSFRSDSSVPTPLQSNPAQSYVGYRLGTYEGDGPRAEALSDLYVDSPRAAREAWDKLDFELDGKSSEVSIGTPNYLARFDSAIKPGDVGRYERQSIYGRLNSQIDVDTFRLWALDGEDGWTASVGEYRVIATVEVFEGGSVHCRLVRLEDAGDETGTEVAADLDGGECRLSAAIEKSSRVQHPRVGHPQYYLTVSNDESPAHHGYYRAKLDTVVRCDFKGDGTRNREVDSAEHLVLSGRSHFSCHADDRSLNTIDGVAVTDRTSCPDDARVFSFPYKEDLTQITVDYTPRTIGGRDVGYLAVDVIDATLGYERLALTAAGRSGTEVLTPALLKSAQLDDGARHFVRVRPEFPDQANRFSIEVEQGILVSNVRYVDFDTRANEATIEFDTNVPAYTLCYGRPGELIQGTSCSPKFSKLEGPRPTRVHACRYRVAPVPGSSDAWITYLVGAYLPGSYQSIPNIEECSPHDLCFDLDLISTFSAPD